MVLALVLASVSQIFSLIDPLIFKRILDDYAIKWDSFSGRQDEFLRGVFGLLGLGIGAAMVARLAKNFQDYFLNVITQRLGAKVYQDGLSHSLKLPYQEFEDQRSGETLGILQKVRADIERLIYSMVNIVFGSLVSIIFVTVYAFTVNWMVAPIYFLSIPIIAFMSYALGGRIKRVQKKIVAQTTALAGSTTESLRNIELVKSLGLSNQEIKRLNDTTDQILQLELKKVRYVRSLSFIQGTAINLLRTGILFSMLWLIMQGKMTPGEYVSLLIYSFFVFGPLQELGSVINIYREAQVSLTNFQTLMAKPLEVRPASPSPIASIQTLEFDNVGFQHQSATHPALQGVTFSAKRGETIAFVGPSGAGKTTLVKLLVGLYLPKTGEIMYNGIPGIEIDFEQLRERIGFVTQDTQLFSGTIRDNLKFVRPEASDAECLAVLEGAAATSLLRRADKGLDTVIGEGGIKVSGGERQRLSIARALLRRPDLMVFDEATSALDSLTESEITKTIRKVSENGEHITIMIAHRLSTILHADKIYVLEQGQMAESGSHQQLVDDKGLYYAMWRQQIGERKPLQPVAEIAAVV